MSPPAKKPTKPKAKPRAKPKAKPRASVKQSAGPKVIAIPIAKITPASYNPRQQAEPGTRLHSDLTRSLDEFGLVVPLVYNERSGNLVSGHQRLALLIEQGAKEVACSVVDLDDITEKALNLALNRINGEWEPGLLNLLTTEIARADDLLVAAAGFSPMELEALAEIDDLEIQLREIAATAPGESAPPSKRTIGLTDADAPSATEFPPEVDLPASNSDLPARLASVGDWIEAWREAARMTPTDFAAAIAAADKTKFTAPPHPATDPMAAAVAVQRALEKLG